jgi:hypothetical protein
MNLEQENALLKRQLTAAITALERIKDSSVCIETNNPGVGSYRRAYEFARDALADISRLAEEKDAPVTWGMRFIKITKNGWQAEFFVQPQGFKLFEDQGEASNSEASEDILHHARWFRDMFFHALAKLGVDTSTAEEITTYLPQGTETGRTSSEHENLSNKPK